MKSKTKNTVARMTQMAMLTAISVVLVLLIRIPLFPAMPQLVYDMADVPVLIGAFLFGPVAGLGILVAVSAIQAFLLSPDGWVGLVMHVCASGALVLGAGLFYLWKKTAASLILGLVIGSLCMTALMVPLNLFFTVRFYGAPYEFVKASIFPFIIPFNLIKSFVNSALAFGVFQCLRPFLKRNLPVES